MDRNTYIIGEIGLCHNGNIDIAHELIDKSFEAGINAVKFQKRTVDILATNDVLDQKDDRFPFLGSTYREIRENLEFSKAQYNELKNHSKDLGLDFIVTPFDKIALEFILDIGVDAVKLASHSLTNLPFLREVAEVDLPIIFSTGMSTFRDIDTALEIFKKQKESSKLTMLHCVSSYPTPDNECQLNFIPRLIKEFRIPIGYSGHEIGYLASLYAVVMGASMIERHITLDNEMDGFDHKVALNPSDLKSFVLEVEKFEKMFGNINLERNVTNVELITKNKYHVSAISNRLIKKGEVLTENDIIYKNPGTGIAPKNISQIIGKKAVNDIKIDMLLSKEMFI